MNDLFSFIILSIFFFTPIIIIGLLRRKNENFQLYHARIRLVKPLHIPHKCVITGETTIFIKTLIFYKIKTILFIEYSFSLPFSENGWKLFQKRYPKALALYKKGLHFCFSIPLLKYVLIPFYFAYIGLAILFPITMIEMLFGKRRLIKLHEPVLDYLNLSVPSEDFIEELIDINL